jgi:hypothetical protein
MRSAVTSYKVMATRKGTGPCKAVLFVIVFAGLDSTPMQKAGVVSG